MAIVICPKCASQLEVKVSFASTPRKSEQSSESTLSVADCLQMINDDDLKGKELDFVTKTRERYDKWGQRIMMSDPQMKWLRGIAERGF